MRRGAGGIAGLCQLLREHGGAIEADLSRYHGKRLRHLHTGELTRRELIAYIKHLPRDSALAREIHGEAAEWGPDTHLLGDLLDVLQIANWQRAGKKRGAPKPIKRPQSKQA